MPDLSADIAHPPGLAPITYYAHAFGRSVIATIYPRQTGANYGYF